MPYFKSHPSWFVRNLLGNYEFAPVFIYETGGWGTVQSGTDSNLNGDSAPDRAIFNPAGVKGMGSDVTPLFNSSGYAVAYLAKNPNAQYIVAGQLGLHAAEAHIYYGALQSGICGADV
jgi:hypothetical protein